MSIQQRVEKLEQAATPEDDRITVLWRSVVRRDEHGHLVEAVHSAHILAGLHGSAETLVRHETDREGPFIHYVIDAAKRIHGKAGPAYEASIRWTPQPHTHHTE